LTIGKKLFNSNTSSTRPHNMVKFGPLTAEIYWRVWGTPTNFNGFASWWRYCRHSSSGRQPYFAALNRRRHVHQAGRPSRWALAHIIVLPFFLAYSQRSETGCLPYFHTWCGLSAYLECMAMCCTRLAENTGRKKSPSWHNHTTLSGCIFAAKACINNQKKTC